MLSKAGDKMAIEKILEEVKKLSPQERKKLVHLIEKENEPIFKEKEPEKSMAALKKLIGLISDPEGGSHTYEKDLYGGPGPL